MTVSRYKLDGNTTAHTSGSKTLTASSLTSFNSSPTPPTGCTQSVLSAGVGWMALSGSVTDTWIDWYVYKYTSLDGIVLAETYVLDWAATISLYVSTSGGIGKAVAGSAVPAYSGLDSGKTADGVVANNTWHRFRLEMPTGGTGTLKCFLGANRHGTTPDYTVSYIDPTGTTAYMSIGAVATTSAHTTRFSDVAAGLYADTVPARSATDWAPSAATLTATATMTAGAGAIATAAATPTATGTLTAAAITNGYIGANLTATGSLTSLGSVPVQNLNTTPTATGVLTATANTFREITAALTATGGITVAADVSQIVYGELTPTATGVLTASAYRDDEITPGYLYGSVTPSPVT